MIQRTLGMEGGVKMLFHTGKIAVEILSEDSIDYSAFYV